MNGIEYNSTYNSTIQYNSTKFSSKNMLMLINEIIKLYSHKQFK